MSGYIGPAPVPQSTQTREAFTATSGQTTFNTAGYSPGYVDVFLNGVKLAPADYTATNGSDIVLATGAAAGDILETVAYEIFQVADQDFTGDFTVDGSTFVVDSTNNRVGIGTSSPNTPLSLNGGQISGVSSIYRGTTATTQAGIALETDGTHKFMYGSAEQVRIDSSGNVGIGTSSPTHSISLEQSNKLGWVSTVGSDKAAIEFSGVDDSLRFYNNTGSTERMRIDSSGNLLVGKTSQNIGTVGFEATPSSAFQANASTANGKATHTFNRLTSDGDIATFRKDGTTVGSIGTFGGRIVFADSPSGVTIDDAANTFRTINASNGGARDGATDLGDASNRWKNLYLSGGVYLGGTGSANHLDDYEEGTWTPSFVTTSVDPTISYNQRFGRYTKIGNTVYVYLYIKVTTASGGSGMMNISGLPFNNSSNVPISEGNSFQFNYHVNTGISGSGEVLAGYFRNNDNKIYCVIQGAGNTAGYPVSEFTTNNNLVVYGSGTYTISS